MQRCPTVGPGSQCPPFGNVSPEQFPNWARVQYYKGGKHGEWRVGNVQAGQGNGIAKVAKHGEVEGKGEEDSKTLGILGGEAPPGYRH